MSSSLADVHSSSQQNKSEVQSALPIILYDPRQQHNIYTINNTKYDDNDNVKARSVTDMHQKRKHHSYSVSSNILDDEMSLPYSWSSRYNDQTASMTRARWLNDNTFGPVVLSQVAECDQISHSYDSNSCINSHNNNNESNTPLYSATAVSSSSVTTHTKQKTCEININKHRSDKKGVNNDKGNQINANNVCNNYNRHIGQNDCNTKNLKKQYKSNKICKGVNNTAQTGQWAQNVWDYITHPVHQPSSTMNARKAGRVIIAENATAHHQRGDRKQKSEWQYMCKTITPQYDYCKSKDITTQQNFHAKNLVQSNESKSKSVNCMVQSKYNHIQHYKSSSISSLYPFDHKITKGNIAASKQFEINEHKQHFSNQKVVQQCANQMQKQNTAKYKQWYELCKNVTARGSSTKCKLDGQHNQTKDSATSIPVSSLHLSTSLAKSSHELLIPNSSSPPSSSSPYSSSILSSQNQHLLDETSTGVGHIPRRRNRLIKRHVSYDLLDITRAITTQKLNGCKSQNNSSKNNITLSQQLQKDVKDSNGNVCADTDNECVSMVSVHSSNIVQHCTSFLDNKDCNDNITNVAMQHQAKSESSTRFKSKKNQQKLPYRQIITQCTPLADKSVNTISQPYLLYVNSANNIRSYNNDRGSGDNSNLHMCQYSNNVQQSHKYNLSINVLKYSNNRHNANKKKSKDRKQETLRTTVNGRGRQLCALFVNDDDDDDNGNDGVCDQHFHFDTLRYTRQQSIVKHSERVQKHTRSSYVDNY